MRAKAVAVLATAAALLPAAGGEALAQPPTPPDIPRALLAFLPTEPAPKRPLLDQLARRGFAVGLTSPTVGGYSARQMLLDISQGARISTRAYSERRPPHLELRTRFQGGRMLHWREAVERADEASDDLVPGLLASSVEAADPRHVAYAGVLGFENEEAIVAANRAGRLERVERTTLADFTNRALRLWDLANVLVVRLPGDRSGLAALDRLMRARRRQDLVLVVRAPPEGRLRLLETGVALPDAPPGGRLRSSTTRRAGLVTATDYAPTILNAVGVSVPDEMDGEDIERVGSGGAAEVRSFAERVDVVNTRRGPVLEGFLGLALVLCGALVLARGRASLRLTARIVGLAALWLPALALATAPLAPGRSVEVLSLGVGALALGAATDRLVRWPAAPAVPAAAALLAYGIDVVAGSPLTPLSLAGSNPKGGARFYGIGNELETILAIALLVGLGAVLARAGGRTAARWFVVGSLLTALVVGAGRLGADVGGVITLGAGGAAAALAAIAAGGEKLRRRTLILVAAAPVAALFALIAIDLVSGGDAHLTRAVLESDRPGAVLEIVGRRFEESFGGVFTLDAALGFYLAAVLLGVGIWKRRELLEPLREEPIYGAGLAGGVAATIVGALSNDSGTLIVMVGTVLLLAATGYARARPEAAQPLSGD